MGTVSRLLAEHVIFRCSSVDRIGIRGYIPGLMYEGGVVKFLLERGNTIPSPAVLNRNHKRLLCQLDSLVATSGVPVVRFKAGQSKEDMARPYQDAATAAGAFGLVLVGKAQERTFAWHGYVDDSHGRHRPNHPHIAWRRQSSIPDHWYLHLVGPTSATNGWYPGDGDTVFKVCSDLGHEGVVAKRLDSPYLPGRRTRTWLKRKSDEWKRIHGPRRRPRVPA